MGKRDQQDATAIRIKPDKRQRIDSAARELGMSRSAYILHCVQIVMGAEGKRAQP